jgi:acyl carrier protein
LVKYKIKPPCAHIGGLNIMKEQIYRIISEISRKEINEISESSYLKNDLNMDSLLVMVVVFRLEKVFKIIITPKEITSLEKVEDIMKLIGTKVKTLEYQLKKMLVCIEKSKK